MLIEEYEEKASRTLPAVNNEMQVAILCMGLAGEAGEVVDYMKKCIGHGHDFDSARLAEELGDLLWYISGLCRSHGLSLSEVAQRNIDKLMRRYPEGFSQERSIGRTE